MAHAPQLFRPILRSSSEHTRERVGMRTPRETVTPFAISNISSQRLQRNVAVRAPLTSLQRLRPATAPLFLITPLLVPVPALNLSGSAPFESIMTVSFITRSCAYVRARDLTSPPGEPAAFYGSGGGGGGAAGPGGGTRRAGGGGGGGDAARGRGRRGRCRWHAWLMRCTTAAAMVP